jgi:thiamine-phosphate pyrophosphorylase
LADNLARAQLARLAWSFARNGNPRLLPLVLFTDDARLPDPLPSIRALPRGSMVVVRHRNGPKRRALASAMASIAHERTLTWLVADDPHCAADLRAHGVHFPEAKIALAAHWRAVRPRWLITCAAHSLSACVRASRAGADAIFLASSFATHSHPGQIPLGPLRTRMIAQHVVAPIYALGGIDAQTGRRLAGARIAGVAVIGALAVDGARL